MTRQPCHAPGGAQSNFSPGASVPSVWSVVLLLELGLGGGGLPGLPGGLKLPGLGGQGGLPGGLPGLGKKR